jgi:hypothetical protein
MPWAENILLQMFLLCLFLFLAPYPCPLFAQNNYQFTQIKRNIYSDGIKSGKLHDFRNVFETDPLSLKKFNKFNNARKTQRILNYTGLGLTGAGALTSLILISENRKDTQSPTIAVSIFGIMAIGPAIILVSNPIAGLIKNNRKRNLLNGSLEHTSTQTNTNTEVSFIVQNGGIGMVVHF